MAAKRNARVFAFALLGAVAGTAVFCFARSSLFQIAYNKWNIANGPATRFGTGTSACLMTERNRIEVYDLRRGSAPIYTANLSGPRCLGLMYWCYRADLKTPPRLEIQAPAGPNQAGQMHTLFALNVDVPAGATVDMRHPNVYEAESGSSMMFPDGEVFRFKGSGYQSESASLTNKTAVTAATMADPIRVIVRPDMSSRLCNAPQEKVMLARNGRYYVSGKHPSSGISAAELEEATKRNPPREGTGRIRVSSVSSSAGMVPGN